MTRCQYCDYTQFGGSEYAGVPPGKNGKVRRRGKQVVCDKCWGTYRSRKTIDDIIAEEDTSNGETSNLPRSMHEV